MLIGSLSLLATPWLTGFYSKDFIIKLVYAQYNFTYPQFMTMELRDEYLRVWLNKQMGGQGIYQMGE